MDAIREKYPFLDVASGYCPAPTGRVLARVRAEPDADKIVGVHPREGIVAAFSAF